MRFPLRFKLVSDRTQEIARRVHEATCTAVTETALTVREFAVSYAPEDTSALMNSIYVVTPQPDGSHRSDYNERVEAARTAWVTGGSRNSRRGGRKGGRPLIDLGIWDEADPRDNYEDSPAPAIAAVVGVAAGHGYPNEITGPEGTNVPPRPFLGPAGEGASAGFLIALEAAVRAVR